MAGDLCWEFLLASQASSLTFEEVVDRVLVENQDKRESSLNNVQKLWARLCVELQDLSKACERETNKSAQKRMKKDMEQRWRDLEGLEATISEYEYDLRRAQAQPENAPVSDDGQSDPGAKGAMAITPVADDTPPAPHPSPWLPLLVRNRPVPWRWMMGMSTKPKPAPSLPGRMSS